MYPNDSKCVGNYPIIINIFNHTVSLNFINHYLKSTQLNQDICELWAITTHWYMVIKYDTSTQIVLIISTLGRRGKLSPCKVGGQEEA